MTASGMLSDAKRRLLDGARGLFAQKGYTNTSIRDIAKACGINSATLYSHFPSKADLYVQMVDPYLDAAQHAFSAAGRTEGNGITRLEAMMHATIEVQRTYRGEYVSLVRDWHNICRMPELAHLLERRRIGSEFWLAVIKDGISDGSIRGDVHPGQVQWLIANFVAAVFDDRFEGAAEEPAEAERRAALAVLLDGLRDRSRCPS